MSTQPLRTLLEQAFPDATELQVTDRTGGGDHFLVAGALRGAAQELVRRELERLVGERVRVQLPGRVGLQLREEQEALAADLHHRVLRQ